MTRRAASKTLGPALGLALLVGGLSPQAQAEQPSSAFQKRFAALAKQRNVLEVKMKASDDPEALPDTVKSGMVNVAGGRMGIYEPPVLSPEDMMTVVNKHMVDIRKCYKKQLSADPEWADNMILDIAVKKTGRVSEVEISPGRVAKAEIGRCLMSSVPKWEFPRFTGELEEGITQEVVNASVPLAFNAQ